MSAGRGTLNVKLPLDLACHQSVSEYKPCTNPMDFFILRPDMKRNRTTRPVISQIASEWPAVSDSSDWWDQQAHQPDMHF